jgi:hypothetical protein
VLVLDGDLEYLREQVERLVDRAVRERPLAWSTLAVLDLPGLVAVDLSDRDLGELVVLEEGQQVFGEAPFVLLHTGSPVVVLREKAYVGGKGVENRGGGEVDFLVSNELTHNVAFVEIKTPGTEICGGAYRTSGAFSLSKDLSGGVVQVLGYRDRFEKEFNQLRADSDVGEFSSFNPRCVLIAGRASSLGPDEARSFELFRNALADVEIWTFDEVAARLEGIRAALAAPASDDS